ncbi:MAG TPA: hypothetical protein PLZ75_09505 [Bacteroidales bacterium]|nr:hypothetical protein [Bacteroidales bacterium]
MIKVPLKLTFIYSLTEELTALFRSLSDTDADPALPESLISTLISLGVLLQPSQDWNKKAIKKNNDPIPIIAKVDF